MSEHWKFAAAALALAMMVLIVLALYQIRFGSVFPVT